MLAFPGWGQDQRAGQGDTAVDQRIHPEEVWHSVSQPRVRDREVVGVGQRGGDRAHDARRHASAQQDDTCGDVLALGVVRPRDEERHDEAHAYERAGEDAIEEDEGIVLVDPRGDELHEHEAREREDVDRPCPDLLHELEADEGEDELGDCPDLHDDDGLLGAALQPLRDVEVRVTEGKTAADYQIDQDGSDHRPQGSQARRLVLHLRCVRHADKLEIIVRLLDAL